MVKAGLKDRPGAWRYGARQPSGFTAYCASCKCEREFARSRVRNWRHFFATLFTGGLWLIGWLAICIESTLRPWRCNMCGWHKPEFRLPLDESMKIAKAAQKRQRFQMDQNGDKIVVGPWRAERDETNFRATS